MIEHVEQYTIRAAKNTDFDAIVAFDSLAQDDAERRAFLQRAVTDGFCSVIGGANEPVGYIIVTQHFFGWPFIDLVYVRTDYRRYGFATALMRHVEATCGREKLFTSTNLSNLPMQRLLEKLGYTITGVVHNLDEGDPEVFYFKRPAQTDGKSGYNTTQLAQ